MPMIASLLCGLIFGAGLLISGMVQPTKVLGFLDIFGAWDPSLAVVMAAGMALHDFWQKLQPKLRNEAAVANSDG